MNFMRGVDKQVKIRKESNMFKLIYQKTPVINKRGREKQNQLGKKIHNKITRINTYLSIITLNEMV
jgi:hypothetical protein